MKSLQFPRIMRIPPTYSIKYKSHIFNTLRPRQNGRHFPDDIFKCIFLNENVRISIEVSLKFVPKGSISNIPALVHMMAWRRLGDKPLSEPMLACSPTHICVSRPQYRNILLRMSSRYLMKLLNQHVYMNIYIYIHNVADGLA